MKLLQLIFCIVFPPVGVFLTVGVSTALIINIVLTLIGFVPGIIHALWILSKQSESVNA
ncbi:MAG: YqaE/Pmp3 family membrane protein [Prochloraceae cyanobacterium]